MLDFYAIIVLGIIVLVLLVERYFIIEQATKEKEKLLDELSKAIKAVISKNANDYVMTTSIDKVPSEAPPEKDPDEIPEEALSDDEFFKAVHESVKS